MKDSVKFDKSMIAPCGMNCGTCLGFLREKNKCKGCRVNYEEKLVSRVRCVIKNCASLAQTESKFCYECDKFPCKRMKQLDKRYRTRYNTSLIENLLMIREKSIESFLVFETTRRTCPGCGSALSVHRKNCLKCNLEKNEPPVAGYISFEIN